MTQDELLQLIDRAAAEKWTELDLSSQELTKFPPEIGKLTSLKRLYLKDNQLTAIPPEITQLTHLKALNLGNFRVTKDAKITFIGNKIRELPLEISQLTSLISLSLIGNQLTAIPPEIGQLTSLTELHLSFNKLTTVPPEIGQLTNLTGIDLGFNRITAVPPEIEQLTNLTWLNLSGNKLTTVPSEISQLTNLISLSLIGNQLTAVPPEIANLANLTELYLNDNQLTSIPSEIIHLTNLTNLFLRNNQLKHLPVALQQLTQLQYLDLRSNPALGISPEMLAQTQNPKLILNAYFGERRPLHEAKMLLVGQGGVGKTALTRRLLYDRPPEETQGKTEGVDIHKYTPAPALPSSSSPLPPTTPALPPAPITLNLWDFGGQGVYQATHQFFFTTRSLYLVVINARTGEQESRLRHWLKLVGSLSDNAPVIIVINKQDEHALTLDERELKAKYPNLLQIIATSCTTGDGIPKLRTAIASALTHLPHINDKFPTAWFTLKKQLEAMEANYITYEQYATYCHEAGIESQADQRSWVQVLHQLGVILNYQDDHYRQLEGTHVLKPEWVTDGVYRILSDPQQEIAQNSGILTNGMLDNILDADSYPPHKQAFIVGMMQKFELSFPIAHRPNEYLIPDLLPKEQPAAAALFEEAQSLQFQIHYSDFLPSSILSRFMVGMMAVLDRHASWRQGAILNFDDNRALVRADLEARQLFITVTGAETTRRSLLNSIRMQLHAIHSTFPNLPLTEHIPIPNHPGITIAYHALCNLEKKGITHHYDPNNDLELDVTALLAGIETVALRQERQVQEMLLSYTLEEIKQLCFVLEPPVEYESLPGQTNSAKTRELVQYMGRRGGLAELQAKLGSRRG